MEGCPNGDLKCSRCKAEGASNNRQRTAYANPDNMAIYCPSCQEEADAYWKEQWDEYYGAIL